MSLSQVLEIFLTAGLAAAGTVIWWLVLQVIELREHKSDGKSETGERIARMETDIENMQEDIKAIDAKFEKWFVLAAAKGLHSPDDHLGTDRELEEFVKMYKEHHHELDTALWAKFKPLFARIMCHSKADPTHKLLAEALYELSLHKLRAFNKALAEINPPSNQQQK